MPFKKNINGNGTPTPDEKKPDTRTNDEIPIEELQNLIAEEHAMLMLYKGLTYDYRYRATLNHVRHNQDNIFLDNLYISGVSNILYKILL